MTFSLLMCSALIISCILLSKITYKLGVPSLLLFILLGMIVGSDGFFKIAFSDYYVAEQFCTIALIFIIFYGGFGTNWSTAKPVIKPAVMLSTLGVILTAAITGLFCYFILHIELIESLLIGAVISSTDAASVFSILRSKKLNLKDGTASILELESGSNDPIAYTLTLILIQLLNQTANYVELPLLILKQIGYGAIFGILIGVLTTFILKKVKFMVDGLETIFVLAIAIISFTLPTMIGGNGYLATYLSGIIIGNSTIANKIPLVHFFDGVTGLAQILIFFLLGLLAFPSKMPAILIPAVLIFIWLTVVARPLSTFLLLKPFRNSSINQKLLLSWSGLRGASSIVFAILVTLNAPNLSNDVFHIIFCICLISVALQGTLLPTVAHKLAMIDNNVNVLKTFTDYQETEHLPLLKIFITPNHNWANRLIRELNLSDTLILMIRRNEQTIVPNGGTCILPGDIAVISGERYHEQTDISLNEVHIDNNHPWLSKPIKSLDLPPQTLIILIKRQNKTSITPKGDTIIQLGDTVILTCEPFNQCKIECT